MRPLPLLLLASALALLAGCVNGGDDGGAGGDGGDGNATDGDPRMTTIPIAIQAAGPGPLTPGGSNEIDVPANATALLVEARWTCATPTCDLTLHLLDADGAEVTSGSGNGEATLSVQAPEAGTYALSASASTPVVGVEGEARAAVFTGPVPDGFSVWEDEA